MSVKTWFKKHFFDEDTIVDLEKNPIDKAIVERGNTQEAQKIYQARWVWYHTILAVELFFTNLLLFAILLVIILI